MKTKGNGKETTNRSAEKKAGCHHKSWDECPVMRALDLIANKWTVPVIYNLYCAGEAVRFGELQRRVETITQKELTKRLRELERAGLITRRVYPEVPPRVEYRLTEMGRTLVGPLGALAEWAKKYSAQIDANRRRAVGRPVAAVRPALAPALTGAI